MKSLLPFLLLFSVGCATTRDVVKLLDRAKDFAQGDCGKEVVEAAVICRAQYK